MSKPMVSPKRLLKLCLFGLICFFLGAILSRVVYETPLWPPVEVPSLRTEGMSGQAETPQQRMLLTPAVAASLNAAVAASPTPAVAGDFNFDPPTSTTKYEGSGLSVELPYNPAWGTKEYQLTPYDAMPVANGVDVRFGPGNMTIGGYFIRGDHLIIGPAKTAAEEKAAFLKVSGMDVRAKTVSGFRVLEGVTQKLTPFSEELGVVILGKKHDYRFMTEAAIDDQTDIARAFKYLEDIVSAAEPTP